MKRKYIVKMGQIVAPTDEPNGPSDKVYKVGDVVTLEEKDAKALSEHVETEEEMTARHLALKTDALAKLEADAKAAAAALAAFKKANEKGAAKEEAKK